ncbi:MAG: T9SS type A sorting domain-containing protein [Bacteroidales bacterium]|nr:T9SS type A sorting domain-containing protein [Bacteroidales bacterium]
MKKVVFSLILLCCCMACFAVEPVEVMVLMKARYDRVVNTDFDNLSPGIYLIQYRQGTQLKTKKVVVRDVKK